MNLVVVTPPPAEPVNIDDVYAHLRITPYDGSQEGMLRRHIASARGDAERITKRALVQQTIRLTGARFPRSDVGIDLLRPPLIAVQSVSYYDEENVSRTVVSSNYYTTSDLVPRLRFVDGYSAPSSYARSDAVSVEYVAGYPPAGSSPVDYAANIPAEIKSAILLGVQLLYDPLEPKDRESMESARDALLAGFIVYTL